MQRYIAFLSGLPLGPDKVGAEDLRNLFRKLGFLNVETWMAADNVAFETAPVGIVDPLEAQISRHLKRSIEGDIWTFIRTPRELQAIVSALPFTAEELDDGASSVFVVLLPDSLDERTERQLKIRRNNTDVLRPRGREIYWLRRATDDASSRPLSVADMLDSPATVRSFRAIEKLAAKYPDPPDRATESQLFRR